MTDGRHGMSDFLKFSVLLNGMMLVEKFEWSVKVRDKREIQ